MEQEKRPAGANRPNRRASYIGAVVFNAILLYVLNRLPDWNVPVVTDAWRGVLWAVNLSLAVQIIGNFALIFHHPLILHYQANVLFNAVSAVGVYVVYRAFPFDFSIVPLHWFALFFRVLLIFTLLTTIVSAAVYTLKMAGLLFSSRRG